MKRLAKKDKGAFLCARVLNIHSGCVLDHLLLFWRKGPQTRRDTKPDKHYADCSRCFLFSYSTSYPGGAQRSCSFGSQPLPSLVSPLAVAGAGHLQVTLSAQEQEDSWGSTFPVLQAEQHLQCLPRTARVWLGVLIPLQCLPSLGQECCEHGPAFLSMEPSSIPTSLSF